MNLNIGDPGTNARADVALGLPSGHLCAEQLIKLLQTATLHLRHEEEDESNGEQRDAAVDHAHASAQIARLVLHEGVDVGDKETRDKAEGCGEGDGAFAELGC